MNTATKPRSLNEVLAEITAGAQRVSIATRSWPAFLPKPASLDEVAATLTGLQRSVAELRGRMEADASTDRRIAIVYESPLRRGVFIAPKKRNPGRANGRGLIKLTLLGVSYVNTTDRSVSSAAMQHAQGKRAKVSTTGAPAIKGESVQFVITANGGRIVVTACDRSSHARTVELDLSQRAAARLGCALVRKDAEINGIGGVRPIVLDSLTLVLLQEVEDTLCVAQRSEAGNVRHLVDLAKSVLRNALCRIETGASHG